MWIYELWLFDEQRDLLLYDESQLVFYIVFLILSIYED